MESAGMSAEELQEALDHDVAQKANAIADGAIAVHPGVTVTLEHVDALEVKQAYFAKAVSISYVDTAHACVRLALREIAPTVDTTGDTAKANKKIDTKRVEALMSLGERAVNIAKALDHLGDKSLLRYKADAPGVQETEQ